MAKGRREVRDAKPRSIVGRDDGRSLASARSELLVLARRAGVSLSKEDLAFALGLEERGHAGLERARLALAPEDEPATSFSPDAVDR